MEPEEQRLTQEMLLFLIRIDLNVLIGNPLFLQSNPCPLNKGAKLRKKSLRILCIPTIIDNAYPARIKHQCLRTLVLRDRLRCEPRSYGVNVLVRYSRHVAKRLCTWERVNRCVSPRARLHRVYMHEIPQYYSAGMWSTFFPLLSIPSR